MMRSCIFVECEIMIGRRRARKKDGNTKLCKGAKE
jgi:hypothetical protein